MTTFVVIFCLDVLWNIMRQRKQNGRVQIIKPSMRTVHRLVVQAIEVCAE